MPNAYCDVAQFQRRFVNNVSLDAGDLLEIERLCRVGSRRVDEYCRRFFYALTATRYFDGNGQSYMRLPDLAAATSVDLDENTDQIYETNLSAVTDYYLQREGAVDVNAQPSTIIYMNIYQGKRFFFFQRPSLLRIAAQWGYSNTTETLAPTATVASASTTTLTTSAAGDIAIGQTLLIGTEQVYISAGAHPTWTISRGVNGTTAATHAALSPILRPVYPEEVAESALIMAGRLWKRRETAYANVIANPVVGSYETYKQFDPDVSAMLVPYIREVGSINY